MRVRTEGGLSGTYNTPTVLGGSGMWSMRDVERNVRSNAWPSDFGDGVDANFNTNMLLLHADGDNADTNNRIIDSSTDKIPFTGTYSVYQAPSSTLATPSNAAFGLPGVFTLEFFINFQTALAAGSVLGVQASGGLVMYYDGTRFTPNQFGTGNIFNSTFTSINLNQWYHIVLRRNSSNLMTMYVDGVSVGSTTTSTTYSTGVFTIGSAQFGGYISNLRITNTDVYGGAPTIPTSTLTAVSGTQLLVCQSSTLVDVSANAFTLTSAGAPTVSSGSYPIALTRTSNPAQGTFSPYTVADGYWSTYYDGGGYNSIAANANFLIGTQNFTMEFWVMPIALATSGIVVSHQTGGMFQFNMNSTGTIGVSVNNNGGTTTTYATMTSTTALTAGVWTHVAIVRNGTEVACYFNGVKDATTLTLAVGTNIGSYGGNKAIYIGTGADTNGKFTGYISNLRYIVGTAQYTTGFTPPTTPLTAASGTQILTCMHNRFRDISSNSWAVVSNAGGKIRPESPFAPTSAYSPSAEGGSLSFNGSSDYARIAIAQGMLGLETGDFTIECWAYFYSVATPLLVFDLRTSGGGASQVKPTVYFSASGSVSYYVSGASRITTTGMVAGQWYHIAVVRSSGVTRLYVNGVANATTYTDTNNYGTSSQFTVGTAGDSLGTAGTFMNGHLADIRVTKSAVYTSAFTPPTSPLSVINNTTMLLSCTNGKIIDQTSSMNISTFSGAKLSTNQEQFGASSILLNGTTDYISQVGQLPGFGKGDFTIECWIYLNSTSGTQSLFDQRPAGTASNANYATLAYTSNSLNYYTGAGLVITGGALNAGQWYHVALCRSSGSTKLFVDGVQKGSTYTDSQTYVNGTNRPIIGADGNNPATSFFNGYIDELRVSRVARYTANFTSPVIPFKNR